MTSSIVKIWITVVLEVMLFLFTFGIAGPFLISAADSILIIAGFIAIVLLYPALAYTIYKLGASKSIKKLKVQNETI